MRILFILTIAVFLSLPALAETNNPVFLLGQNESLLHISATEQREVDQDLLVATLRIQNEDDSNKAVQNAINTAMAKALEEAKKYDDVKAITRYYNVHQYDKNGGRKNLPRHMRWRGQQSLELKSKNSEQLLELAGKIQTMGFTMNGLNYTLSPALAAQTQDEMLEAALEKLQSRAMRAAKALGKSKAELKEINTQGQYTPRPVYSRSLAAQSAVAEDVATPVASPGETTLNMTVSAKALLR